MRTLPNRIPPDSASTELRNVAQPILDAPAFKRLNGITFLGILSPDFGSVARRRDGTRAEHSIGVAWIALDIARCLGMSSSAQRYAVAWGLLHDIATWPLSHTSEPAFTSITGVNVRTLRRMIIVGDRRLPANFSLRSKLREMGVRPDVLLALFETHSTRIDPESRLLWQVVHSRVTPDTLEGIARCAAAYEIGTPNTSHIWANFGRDLFNDVTIKRNGIAAARRFWRKKGYVYENFINNAGAILLESRWSSAIELAFQRISLGTSLLLSEEDLIGKVNQFELPHVRTTIRYKPPLVYSVSNAPPYRHVTQLPISELHRFLQKSPMTHGGSSSTT
ncbi:MAG: HD domain-containing protein [Polyangiaceae bacterium]|nr:HD domain-containing protein [Polyangiaceae bacterium]